SLLRFQRQIYDGFVFEMQLAVILVEILLVRAVSKYVLMLWQSRQAREDRSLQASLRQLNFAPVLLLIGFSQDGLDVALNLFQKLAVLNRCIPARRDVVAQSICFDLAVELSQQLGWKVISLIQAEE